MKVYSINCLLGVIVGGNSFNLLSNSDIEKNINMFISLTVRDRAISLKFSTHRVSKKCTIGNFSPKMAAILNFQIFAKNGKKHKFPSISLTVRDRVMSKFSTHRSLSNVLLAIFHAR